MSAKRLEGKSKSIGKKIAVVGLAMGLSATPAFAQEPTTTEPIQFVVEDMPEFPGGSLALRMYIAENTRFPEAPGCDYKAVSCSFTVLVRFGERNTHLIRNSPKNNLQNTKIEMDFSARKRQYTKKRSISLPAIMSCSQDAPLLLIRRHYGRD